MIVHILVLGAFGTLFQTCLATLGAPVCNGTACPEQRHLSFGHTPDVMIVMWVTPGQLKKPTCKFGPLDNLHPAATVPATTAKATSTKIWQFGGISEYSHTCELTGLGPSQKYAYMVGDEDSGVWSETESFTAKTVGNAWSPNILVYGDLGHANDVSLPSLVKEVDSGSIDFVLHAGDLAYDLQNEGGKTGRIFMRDIDPIASRVPYFTTIGNHEGGTDFDHISDLYHYMHRFQMPGKGDLVHGQKGNNVYYSFDAGPAHFLVFSSEVYFWQLWDIAQQYEFIKHDLERVNRSATPWIITMAHRPMYCSNVDSDDCGKNDSSMRTGLPVLGHRLFKLEDLFHKHKVDLSIWAHEHSYERTWPVFDNQVMNGSTAPFVNPGGTVHIITGNAGCRENHDHFKGPRGDWSAVRSETYGYGKLKVWNHTHLQFSQLDVDTDSLVDDFMLVKTKPANNIPSPTPGHWIPTANQGLRAAVFSWSRGCTERNVFPQDGCHSGDKAAFEALFEGIVEEQHAQQLLV